MNFSTKIQYVRKRSGLATPFHLDKKSEYYELNSKKYKITTIPRTIRYQPNTLKSLVLMYFKNSLIVKTEMTNATTIPTSNSQISVPVNTKPSKKALTNFSAEAPNIIGILIKNEKLAANGLDVPTIVAPKMVEPERDVPGTSDNT